MTITKNQHYIPQGILKAFATDNKKVFELYKNRILSRKEIKKTMCHNMVYEHDALPTNTIENIFADSENEFIPIHNNLIKELTRGHAEGIIPYKRIEELLYFYVLLYLRSGALLEEYSFYSDSPKSQRVETLLSNIVAKMYPLKLKDTILQGYKLAVLVDQTESFCMSDQFISTVSLRFKNKFSNVSNRQIGFKNTMVLIPISSKFYLAFYHGEKPSYIKENEYCNLGHHQLDEINSVVNRNSYNKTICKNNDPLNGLKATEEKSIGPYRTILYYSDGTVSINTTKKEIEFYYSEESFSAEYLQIHAQYKEIFENKIKRNDRCLCNSEKKYKKCCLSLHERSSSIVRELKNKDHSIYKISPRLEVETGIEVYRGPKSKIPDNTDIEIMEKIKDKIPEN